MKNLFLRFYEAVGDDGAAGGGGESSATSGDQRTVEDRALEMGWIPKEEFKGDPSRFISAEDFVRRGEQFMPVLKANNRRLETRFNDLSRQNQVLQTQLDEVARENEELRKGQTKLSVEELKSQRTELAIQLKAAREAEDTVREIEILGEVDELNQKIRESESAVANPKPKRRQTQDPIQSPDYQKFIKDYPWYGTDKRKTALANAIGDEIKSSNPELVGKNFFDKVSEELDKELSSNQRRSGASRVEGGARGTSEGGGGSATGKTYADLPADAREACNNQGKRLVGPGKRFKDEASWRSYYVEQYFK